MHIALLSVRWLVKDFAAQIRKPFSIGALTHHEPRSCPCPAWLCALSPVAVSPLRTGAGLARSLLHGFGFLIAVIRGVSIFILAHHDPPLEPPRACARTSTPGTDSPLIASRYMCTVSVGAASGVQFQAMIRIEERVDGPAVVVAVWMTRRHGAVLLGGREVVWIALTPVHQLVTVIDADHLSRCLTLTTSHRARAPLQGFPLPTRCHGAHFCG